MILVLKTADQTAIVEALRVAADHYKTIAATISAESAATEMQAAEQARVAEKFSQQFRQARDLAKQIEEAS